MAAGFFKVRRFSFPREQVNVSVLILSVFAKTRYFLLR